MKQNLEAKIKKLKKSLIKHKIWMVLEGNPQHIISNKN